MKWLHVTPIWPIGILVIQDLAAVLFLAFSTGKIPEPAALLLLALWPLRGLLLKLLARSGHDELFTLFGLVLALGGAELFDTLGIKGDLGALIIGGGVGGASKIQGVGAQPAAVQGSVSGRFLPYHRTGRLATA